jgi:RsiW-degrading membrane proteinase PrsW (M82 family)
MPIPVACGGCGKRFKAPDRGAGKKVPCPACKTIISIPAAVPERDDDEYRLAEPEPRAAAALKKPKLPTTTAAISAPVAEMNPRIDQRLVGASEVPSPVKPAWVPPTRSPTPTWLRHLHWCLALAMIPLAVSIFVPDHSIAEQVEQGAVEPAPVAAPAATGRSSPPAGSQPATGTAQVADEPTQEELPDDVSLDVLFAALPGHKLPGAFLARDTYIHWLFALLAAGAFMCFMMLLASDKSAQPLHLLGLGLFTATGGILLLLFVQVASVLGVARVRGVAGFVALVLALIGLSYRAALDPDIGLIGSFIGFTFGVGLCEEVCKAIPILIYYRIGNKQTWRGAFLWGLASGVGFGVSESVMYSQDFYNGISGAGIYLVRFISCVALHAIWAGSVGISINQRQDLLREDLDEWWWYAMAVVRLIAIPMVLHGLYDTLLKKDMELLALLTAAASFGYLAWQISHLRGSDDEDERAAYVAQYIRSKAAAQAT